MEIPQRLLPPPELFEAWSIVDVGWRQVQHMLAQTESLRARDGEPLRNAPGVELRGDAAIITVEGPLVRSGSSWSYYWGLCSYEQLRRDLQAALDNPSVARIFFDFDSPGGIANGVGELANAIYNARGIKPIVGYVNGYACSACYEIASACGRLVIDPSAVLGSIGVKLMLIDDSKMLESFGIKEYVITADQSPLKVIDASKEADRERAKKMCTDLCTVFVANVARGRGVDEETVLTKFGRGDVIVGQAAVDVGLADELGDFESLLAQAGTNQPTRSFVMATNPATPTASMKSAKCSGCDREMDDDDDVYCRACHSEADAMRSAMGTATDATGPQLVARASQLATFEREVLAATGAKTSAEAIGKIAAGVAAISECTRLQAEAEKQRGDALQKDFKAALDDRRLTPAHLSTMVPMFVPAAEREKVKAAIAALPSQTREGLVSALCLARATADTLEQVKAFADCQGPAGAAPLPAPRTEQPPATASFAPVMQLTEQQAKEMFPNAAEYGIKPAAAAKFHNVHSVAEIHEAAAKQKQG